MTGPPDPDGWWTSPRLAYGRGLADGYRAGHDDALTGLLDALGGWVELARRATMAVDARSTRGHPTTPTVGGSWPTGPLGGPQEWPGLERMGTDDRKAAYAALLGSWE